MPKNSFNDLTVVGAGMLTITADFSESGSNYMSVSTNGTDASPSHWLC